LSIDGPIGVVHVLRHGPAGQAESLAEALDAADAAAIHAIDAEYAPFWCPPCAASYCAACQIVWTEQDEGFYDSTRAICPQGHDRMIDD
jgi:hypothetical protein